MNTLDKKYQQLLSDILEFGVEKKDRTGTGTISEFGHQIRHKMSEGFPLLTTKKMAFKTMVTELLWFLRGDTNIKFLLDYDCHIWTGDAYKRYVEAHKKEWGEKMTPEQLEKSYPDIKEFENLIKTVPEFAKTWGDLGPIYGKQWRSWKYQKNEWYDGKNHYEEESKSIDQIQNLINELKTNPDSRRLMVSAWNVGELDQMVLPPCHHGFQVYTRELSYEERCDIFKPNTKNFRTETNSVIKDLNIKIMNDTKTPTKAISLMWNQRSVDTFLGLPFNIASYGLLLEIIAKEVNMIPDELIGNLGDVHLYKNHIEQATEQIGRKYTPEERHEMLKTAMGDFYKTAVDEQVPFGGGLSEYYDSYKIPNHTREPFKNLPTLKFSPIVLAHFEHHIDTFDNFIKNLQPHQFIIEGYESHPPIKAPLSN